MVDIYDNVILPSGDEEPIFNGKGIPNNRLFLRLSHSIDKVRGTVLADGDLTYKLTELVQVDPLGIGGKVDVGDIVNVGTIDIRPVFI
jgi:hypothetical protein